MSLEQLMEQLKTGDKVQQSASRTELNKRFAFPFSCIAFALVGVPLGITAHRRETSMGFLLSLVVAFFYFLFIIVADTLRNNPAVHPELLVWFPNLLFIGLGIWMFRRLARQ
jgi:lipopolysaccharide export system permease protein